MHPQQADPAVRHLADSRNLPYQTLRAQQCAQTIQTISRRARSALAAIALTVDVRRPLASVFAHRDYLADRAGLSERTWYRAEQDLVDAGLIRVAEQVRKARGGRFGGAYIYLTREAARILRLVDSPVAQRATDISQEAVGAPSESQSFPSPSANVADPFTNKVYLSPLSQKRQQGELPEDVQPLLSLGFHKYFIFKLMGQASHQFGKKLGHVVTACWDQLRAARRPIAYLRKLLTSSTDFGWLARQRIALQAQKAQAQEATLRDAAVLDAVKGKQFVDKAGSRLFEISKDGAVLTVRDSANGTTRTASGRWISDFRSALERGQVRNATIDDEARHEAARQARSAAKQASRAPSNNVAVEPWKRTEAITASLAAARSALAKAARKGL